ncbi:MAG: bifunctional metallophosphatase/5'-nucleotidase [Exilispira sp.]|jgi:2',3'-cyclic-nucleotide 2'-phosphodiesterase/3'-nucleotidase|nr:bifunctional metallophosphatase/5'-nucleotidase [Exilispira sp.]
MKKLKIFSAIFIILIFIFIFACVSNPYMQYTEKPLQLTFIETSDIHGSIFPYDFINDRITKTSLAQVVTIVNEQRAIAGNNVVLLDNGDILQGQPTVYYYNFENTTDTHIVAQVMNYMKYDAMAMGNHDIEAGHPVYDKMIKEFSFPTLAANAVKPDGNPYFKPYTIVNRGGVKIAILGLITPKIPSWLPSKFWEGMVFEDMVTSAQKWIKIIKEKEKPDLIVGLFHAGVDYTYGGEKADTPNNENASQLVAERVAGFDLIFVGHDHAGWEGNGLNNKPVMNQEGQVVPIYGALNAARKVPVVQVLMKWNKDKKAWEKQVNGKLVNVEEYKPDETFIKQFEDAYNKVKAYVSRPIGKMSEKISSKDSMFGPSAFVDLIHRIQLELTSKPEYGLNAAQISFAAPLTFNATIPVSADNTLYVRDMFNLYQYENFLYTMNLTGKQIKDALEYSYAGWFNTMKDANDHIIAFQLDDKGNIKFDTRTNSALTVTRYYNYDSAVGINYTVDVSKPAGQRVNIISFSDGKPFDMNATYSVAINSYRAQGGGGHLTKGAGISQADLTAYKFVTSSTIKDLRYYLMKWIENYKGIIQPFVYNNWTVIPADWAAAAKAKDMLILYPPSK